MRPSAAPLFRLITEGSPVVRVDIADKLIQDHARRHFLPAGSIAVVVVEPEDRELEPVEGPG
jgi:hypothetical protein